MFEEEETVWRRLASYLIHLLPISLMLVCGSTRSPAAELRLALASEVSYGDPVKLVLEVVNWQGRETPQPILNSVILDPCGHALSDRCAADMTLDSRLTVRM